MTAEERSSELEALAGLHGVTRRYHDGTGTPRVACDEAVLAVLARLGAPVETMDDVHAALGEALAQAPSPRLPDSVVHVAGVPFDVALGVDARDLGAVRLATEEGGAFELAPREAATGSAATVTLPPLEAGCHRLEARTPAGVVSIPVLAFPARLPEAATGWGLFAPLYGLRRRADGGALATYADLARLGRWAAEHRDAPASTCYIGTLPLLAGFFEEPFEPSPYSPISRAFWSELYVDPRASPDLESAPAARRLLEDPAYLEDTAARTIEGRIDYRRAMRGRRRVLEALVHAVDSGQGRRREDFERTLAGDEGLRSYAAWRAAVEAHRWTWEGWPRSARDGELRPGVDYDGEAFRYHAYAQWLAREQVAAAAASTEAAGSGLYLDLPLGSHGGGYDTWRHRDDFVLGVSAGAPPDAVFEGGQDWAFPPMHPGRARRSGWAAMRAALRHHFEHAAVLRVDHVMGLHRLFWIPEGFTAADGVYVRSDARELWAVLAIEAARARAGRGAAVIGEDLGTVPDEVRREMHERGALRMYVLPFERQDWEEPALRTPPPASLACTGTHDMEPFAAWWTGLEASVRGRLAAFLGLQDREQDTAAALAAALAWLASSDATIVLASLEDLWLETGRQNMPGTPSDAGNWQRPFARAFEDFADDPAVAAALASLDAGRRARASRLADAGTDSHAAARSPS